MLANRKVVLPSLLSLLPLVGCGGSGDVATDFQEAMPSQQEMKISVPEQNTAGHALTVGQTADFYLVTRATSETVNAHVGGVLAVLWLIVHTRPTTMTADTATWGPSQPRGLEPLSWRLTVNRVAAGQFAYHLDARPKDSSAEADFKAIITGTAEPSHPAGRGKGGFVVDMTAAHALDPLAWKATGSLTVGYDFGAMPRWITVHYDKVTEALKPPVTADYRYSRADDGSGDFQFSAHADLAHETTALEEGIIRSRWNGQGAGRADARLSGGDAGMGITVSECWDTSFKRVYVSTSAGSGESAGQASSCVFADTLLPSS